MQKGMQAFCAAALSLSLLCGAMTVGAADAPLSAQPVYNVNVENGQVQFLRGGEVAGAFAAKAPVDLIVFTDGSGELIVQFPQPDGTRKSITLADQKTLSVDGQIGRISFDKSLSKEMDITLAKSASASLVLVQSGGQVTIDGKPAAVTVSGAAKVTFGSGASVSTLQVTDAGATVQAAPGAVVAKATAANKASVSGIASVAKLPASSSSGGARSFQGSSSSSGGSKSAGGASSGSNGNTWNSSTPVTPTDPYKDIAVTGIYPASGKIRIELNKAVPLEADAFRISCPTGTDMTVISVKTVDGADHNRIYDLETAHYTDNTYVAHVTLPNGKVLEKQFVTDSLKNITIMGVYPTTRKVRIELSEAVPLEANAFYINCPTGKDMTIISVKTVDGADHNRIYDLETAHYTDNTYVAHVTLPDGKVLEKQFVANSLTPDIYDYRVKRIDAHNAECSFTSDNAGIVYYMAVADNRSRSAIGTAAPQNAEELKRNGASQAIAGGNNVISLAGLTEDVAYTVYLAVADTEGVALSDFLPKLSVPAAPESNPDTGDISIKSVEQIKNNGFRVVLSAPTAQPLDISAFYAKCPAQAALHLGRAETADNQTYEVYLQSGWFYLAKNTYEVKVTFPDGKIATGSFYAGTYPAIGLITAKRVDAGTVQVDFNSDKPGVLYYGTCLDYESKPALEWVMANAEKTALVAGNNQLTLKNVPADHERFYLVAVDEEGNRPSFVDSTAIKNAKALPTGSNEETDTLVDMEAANEYETAGDTAITADVGEALESLAIDTEVPPESLEKPETDTDASPESLGEPDANAEASLESTEAPE